MATDAEIKEIADDVSKPGIWSKKVQEDIDKSVKWGKTIGQNAASQLLTYLSLRMKKKLPDAFDRAKDLNAKKGLQKYDEPIDKLLAELKKRGVC